MRNFLIISLCFLILFSCSKSSDVPLEVETSIAVPETNEINHFKDVDHFLERSNVVLEMKDSDYLKYISDKKIETVYSDYLRASKELAQIEKEEDLEQFKSKWAGKVEIIETDDFFDIQYLYSDLSPRILKMLPAKSLEYKIGENLLKVSTLGVTHEASGTFMSFQKKSDKVKTRDISDCRTRVRRGKCAKRMVEGGFNAGYVPFKYNHGRFFYYHDQIYTVKSFKRRFWRYWRTESNSLYIDCRFKFDIVANNQTRTGRNDDLYYEYNVSKLQKVKPFIYVGAFPLTSTRHWGRGIFGMYDDSDCGGVSANCTITVDQ